MQQLKMGRKALTNMTNSKKPLAKDRSSMKNLNNLKAPEKVVQPKISKKPLRDLTNSKQPCVNEISSKKNCTENVSTVKKEQLYSFASGEGFLHYHQVHQGKSSIIEYERGLFSRNGCTQKRFFGSSAPSTTQVLNIGARHLHDNRGDGASGHLGSSKSSQTKVCWFSLSGFGF
ncbi:unnamed protein product [Amaranthus hypochondriacus]